MNNGMLTEKPIKILFWFTLPLLLTGMIQQVYFVFKFMVVGQFLGEEAIASMGAIGSLNALLLGILQGLATGFALVIAHRMGKGDVAGIKKSFATSIQLTLIIGVLFTALGIVFIDSLLNMQNVQPDIYQGAKHYLLVLFIGFIIQAFQFLLTSVLRALGNPKFPFYAVIGASLINIALDFIFIGGFRFGVMTSAINFIIAQGIIALVCLIFIHRRYQDLRLKRSDFVLTKSEVSSHILMGIPIALQFIITSIGSLFLQATINDMGTTVIAAWSTGVRIDVIALQPILALATSVSIYFAHNIYSAQYQRLRQGLWASVILGLGGCLFAWIIPIGLGRMLIYFFVNNPSEELIAYTMRYLWMFAFFSVSLMIIFVSRNAFQGMGKHFFPLIGGGIETVVRILAVILIIPQLGFNGLLTTTASAWTLAAIALFVSLVIYIYKKPNVTLSLEKVDSHDLV